MRNGYASMARKWYLLQAIIGSFFCSLATASASEPTLQETFDFIERKTAGRCDVLLSRKDERNFTRGGSGDYVITLLDDDTILIKGQHLTHRRVYDEDRKDRIGESRGYTESTWTSRTKVRLADLSTQVKIAPSGNLKTLWIVNAECTEKDCIESQRINQKEIINYIYLGLYDPSSRTDTIPDGQKHSYSSSVLFEVCSQEKAERIKKALTHAIKISGGKDELF